MDKEKLRLEYSNNSALKLEVSSWNHRFKKADDDFEQVKFIPELFNNNLWLKLEMNNRRAEKIKKMLVK